MHIIRPVENFFRKLRFKNKIAIMFIAVIVPFLIPSYFTYESFYKDLKMIKNEQKALKIVNHVSILVKELQEHRGIMQGILNKNENFKKEAVKEEKEINTQFSYLERFKNIIDSAKFKNKWLKIKSTKDPIKNFLLHTKLIEELLFLNKNIAAHYNLYREKNVDSYAATVLIFNILPSIQENIDKIRGSLTGILSKHTIKEKEKIQNLLIELKSKSDMLKHSLHVYLQTKNNHKLINKSKSIETELKNYINSIENIINQESQVSAQNIFKISTKTISKIISFHKELLDSFKIQLEKRKKTAYLKILLLSLGLLSVALTSFYLFLGFYYSIKKPLDKILKATQRLANKDYSKNLTVNTEDEFKEIADTFNKMQKEIKDHISFLKWYQIALDSATLVTKVDIKGDITYANKAFLDAVGYSLDEILGKPHSILRDPKTPKKVYENLWKIILNKRVWRGILKIRAKNGRELVMKTSIVPILNEKGNIKEFVAVRIDITDLVQAQKRIEKMLYFDNLTSLPNRTKLIEDTRKNKIYAVTIFNIDDFRQINDIYGFEAGNQILKDLAKILKTFEKRDLKLYRLPSDEFAFVLFSKKDKEELKKIVLQIVATVEGNSFIYEGFEIDILLRAGAAIVNGDSKNIEKTLLDADTAVKEVKETNYKYLFYDESKSAKEEYKNTLKWIKKIKDAIANDRIVPYFQPIFNNKTKKIEKYEALVRMIDEDGKIISPYFFLDIAKKAKLYTKITKIMFKKSLSVFEKRCEELSINISMQDLQDSNIVKYIENEIKNYHMKKRIIVENDMGFYDKCFDNAVIEITEGEEVENYDVVANFTKYVKKFNAKISIDDFGTGYSNFVYILNMGVDYLKIDGSLIKDILKDDKSLTLVKAISHFTKELGIKTIAEFVSDEKIQKKVEEIGIDYSQGYYISEPVPAEKLPPVKL